MFKKRGYSIAELNNVLYRRLDREERFAVTSRVRDPPRHSRRSRGGVSHRRARILPRRRTRGIPGSADAALPDGGSCDVRCQYRRKNGGLRGRTRYSPASRIRGVRCRNLAEFRGRGVQTALLHARLAAAAEAGCEYAVVVTQGGTTSQRNCERLGFRVAYSKVTVIKNFVME